MISTIDAILRYSVDCWIFAGCNDLVVTGILLELHGKYIVKIGRLAQNRVCMSQCVLLA